MRAAGPGAGAPPARGRRLSRTTYTYLIADEVSRQAALIDPVRKQLERDLKLLDELGLELRYVLDTHVHADHVTAAAALREQTGAQTIGGPGGAACADRSAREGDRFRLGALAIGGLETPGHTDDSLNFLVEAGAERALESDRRALLAPAVGHSTERVLAAGDQLCGHPRAGRASRPGDRGRRFPALVCDPHHAPAPGGARPPAGDRVLSQCAALCRGAVPRGSAHPAHRRAVLFW